MKTIFILLISATFISADLAQGTWTYLYNIPSVVGRYGAIALPVGDKAYAGLGFDELSPLLDWWSYIPSTNTWKHKIACPETLYLMSGFVINGKCYLGLGLNQDNALVKSWYEFDPEAETWTRKADFPQAGRYAASSFVIDSIGYVCCGVTSYPSGSFTGQLWSYDPVKDKWTKKTPFPGKARGAASGFAMNGKGYIEGGYRINKSTQIKYLDDLYEYDPMADSWNKKSNAPSGGETGQACFVIENKAYIGLGQRQGHYTKTFYTYDPALDLWADSITEFPGDGRQLSCSFSINGNGYVMFGYNPYKMGYYWDVWQYTPSSSPRISAQPKPAEKSFVQYTLVGNQLIPSFNQNENYSSFYFTFYDLSGRLIQSQTISESAIIYLDAALSKGIYLAVTSNGHTNSVQKILIQ